MATSKASTVADYLAELPPDRRKELAAVRKVVRKHLPRGYRETMNWGMIAYEIPLSLHPKTYNGKPLMYAALAAQKNYNALYLMGASDDDGLREAFRKAGKKLDMGKSCIRFRQSDDLALPAVARAVGKWTPEQYIRHVEKSRG